MRSDFSIAMIYYGCCLVVFVVIVVVSGMSRCVVWHINTK